MDVFKAQFEQVKKQFAALTATQKMLVFALVAVMGLTLVYWSRYAGSSEMVSLMGTQTLTDAEIGGIDEALAMRGIEHTMTAGKVMVPTELKTQALGVLMYNHKLPSDTRSAFEEMSKTLTPFSSETERQAVYTQALNKQMAVVISGFPGVASATVVISARSEQRVEGSVPPTAMVSITTKGGGESSPDKLARAAADGLAGAVSELTPGHVSVIVDGVPKRFSDSDNGAESADAQQETRKKFQKDMEDDIQKRYSYIAGLTVVVNCDVELKKETIHSVKYDKNGVVSQLEQSVTKSDESQNNPVKNGDTGVLPNAGSNSPVSVGGGGGESQMASNATIEQTSEFNKILVPTTETTTDSPAGKTTSVSAAVGVPLSYIKTDYRGRHPGAKELTGAEFEAYVKAKLAEIRETVAKTVGIKSESDLAVEMYVDAPPEVMAAPAAAGPSAAMTLVTAHGKELAVGLLAVASLFLMVMMVRKSPTVTVMTSAGPMTISGLEQAAAGGAGGGGAAGSQNMVATGGTAALDGMELGDDEVRTQQMLDQVSTMVKENPDGAAALVKRWLSRA
jgi:flagellar biosynthesis/type III secretory pathway M-ring protein FliF/YscJ